MDTTDLLIVDVPAAECRPARGRMNAVPRDAGCDPAQIYHVRGTLACTQLDYVATLWTGRRLEPNRDHAREDTMNTLLGPA